ncbi:MAG: rod shape-determining protein MreC [bacterium]|nr:rod shape-determining protein MreC [bacterium]
MNTGELSSERKTFILVAILFLNLVMVSTHVVLKDQRTLFQSIVATIVSPFQIAFQETADFFSREFKHYIFLKDNFNKYHDIKKKYTRLKYENYILRKKLKDFQFHHQVTEKRDFFTAEVVAIDRNLPLSSLMINKGSATGIKKDMIVLNEAGDLVGKIVEPVTFLSAKVRLISSSIGGVGAYVEKEQLEGLLTGNNSSLCNFKYLMANKSVFKGDRIVTSGTDGIFPPYIPIGEVISVKKRYLLQHVRIKPFFLDKSIKHLVIIKNVFNEELPFHRGKPVNIPGTPKPGEENIKKSTPKPPPSRGPGTATPAAQSTPPQREQNTAAGNRRPQPTDNSAGEQ